MTVGDLLHKTPWWALLLTGAAMLLALGVLVTPVHVMRLEKSGATAAENRAIQREIHDTVSQGALELARRIVTAIRDEASDPAQRADLERALAEIERERADLGLAAADAEVERARREARGAGAPEIPPLPPDVRARIRDKVASDIYHVGLGAALFLVLVPLFILVVVAKIFIDRSRAAQREADTERREAEYQRMSRQVTEAKLSALQAQIEPHFLYNTLASVQALTEVDPARANAMTGHLIQYLRNALPKMRDSTSTLGQEMELVRAYLSILQMRMGERLAFEIALPPELAEVPFPPLMLPSLVENAIKHGLEPLREGGHVRVSASAVDGKVRVRVSDTGRGFGETPGQGVGLANIRERLAALYGEDAHLVLEPSEPRGVTATIEVPRKGLRGAPSSASAGEAPQPARGAARRTLEVVGTAERAWRRGLSFAFVVLVSVCAVVAGLGVVALATGLMHASVGGHTIGGATGAMLGTAGIAVAFAVVVLVLAIGFALVYGLGLLFVGLALFIPLAILVSLFPALAPFILVGLVVWWVVRRTQRKQGAAAPGAPAPPHAGS